MNSYKIDSPYNSLIKLKVSEGHFATSSSHINHYIDLTTLKARASEAKAVAKSMVTEYLTNTVVDAIVCMDGMEVIGAYLADELTESGFQCMNHHGTIYVTTPETNNVGQLTFRDNVIPMINGKHILLLIATASTGHTVEKAVECIEYYGGIIEGISSIFTAIDSVSTHEIHSIFHAKDIESYASFSSHECPYCKKGIPLDGLISQGGISKLN